MVLLDHEARCLPGDSATTAGRDDDVLVGDETIARRAEDLFRPPRRSIPVLFYGFAMVGDAEIAGSSFERSGSLQAWEVIGSAGRAAT
jgi:hypothetical protein